MVHATVQQNLSEDMCVFCLEPYLTSTADRWDVIRAIQMLECYWNNNHDCCFMCVLCAGRQRVSVSMIVPTFLSCTQGTVHEWFLEMCVPSEQARGTKLAANLDTQLQF